MMAHDHRKWAASLLNRSLSALSPALSAAWMLLVLSVLGACSTVSTLDVAPPTIPASPKYAAIVVDGTKGAVLYQVSADSRRYPASLTKMMTLYMMFEAMEQGRISRDTPIPVSAEAARRPPTKIGFKPGDTIDVDTAIRALVTKSANDVATAVGEYLGGSEEQFAAQMTAKARSIGMRSTTFRNASGLPDDEQFTTARDMAVLGLALRRRFPSQYAYFSGQSFAYRGRTIRGHNDLLSSVDGVDGIKTGYIRASGFNIVTSVRRGSRKLVVVVMGGESAAARNRQVADLIERFMPQAVGR